MPFMDWWKERSTNERFAFAGGGMFLLVALAAGAIWAFQPEYESLLSGLDSQDSAGVAGQLSKASIDYKLDPKEGAVLVRKKDIQAARAQVAEEGLPLKKAQGFELFDNADFGMTDFAQRINFQRALEGELTRTILGLEEIERARLHLVLPEQGLFKRNDETPKASLMLVVREGETLTPARVSGIQDLIASSVPGMKPDSVTIHDHRGVSLSGGAAGSSSEGVGGRLDSKRTMELYLTSKAEEALRLAFPNDSIAVAIDVDLDLDTRHVNRDASSASLKPVGLQFSLSTSLSKAGGPTPDENITTPAGMTPFTGAEVSKSVTEHVTESIDIAPGSVRRLTVGILIPPGWSDEGRAELIELVRNSIGADVARGDRVSIMQLPEGSRQATANDRAATAPWSSSTSPGAFRLDRASVIIAAAVGAMVIAIFVLIGFGIGRRSATKRMSDRQRERALSELKEWLNARDRPEAV